ncbi:MAG: hypothetical protein IJI53_11050 [Clostridia bacterium]|nr:hypothetical protein [Clostridia bacterium]
MFSFAAAEKNAYDAAWEFFAEKVTLTIPVYDRGVEGIADLHQNYWTDWMMDMLGFLRLRAWDAIRKQGRKSPDSASWMKIVRA